MAKIDRHALVALSSFLPMHVEGMDQPLQCSAVGLEGCTLEDAGGLKEGKSYDLELAARPNLRIPVRGRVDSNELGLHDFSHSRSNMGVVLAGAGNALNSGRFLDLNGFLYQGLLLTLAHALGAQDLTSFGSDGTQVIPGVLQG